MVRTQIIVLRATYDDEGPAGPLTADGLVRALDGHYRRRQRRFRVMSIAGAPPEGTCSTCGAAYGEMDHAPEPCEGADR